MNIRISTALAATENQRRILKAMKQLFPICAFKEKKKEIYCECSKLDCLSEIKKKIEDKRIANTIRYLVSAHGKIELNKQALVTGKINFVEESYPLGNITIEFDEKEEILNYLAPST